MIDKDTELKLLDYARKAEAHAELVGTCAKHLDGISTDVAQRALAHVEIAIGHLQTIAEQLVYRMDE